MPLLDRYLTAVKFWLPKAQRDDITAELAANLHAEIDDRIAALGRPLSEAEITALLRQQGPPILVASRYQPQKRTVTFGVQLIGPVLFPFYLTAIKVTLVLLLVPGVVSMAILGNQGPVFSGLGSALVSIARLSLPTLVLITLLFAMIDFGLRRFHLIERWENNWDPGRLPSSERQIKQVRRSRSIAGIIIQSIFIVWWWNHGSIPLLVINNTGAQIHFAPIVTALYLPVLIVAFINLAQHWINLVEPGWRWLPPATGLISSLIALIVLYPLLYTSPLTSIFDSSGKGISPHDAADIHKIISLGMVSLWFGIMIVGAIYAWRLVWLAWQSMPHSPVAPTRNGAAHV
jgi:hypothetical protein